MPHMTIEYSSNVAARADMQMIVGAAHRALMATDMFEVGAVRVRAIACNVYSVADGHPENGFVDISLRMGAGRTHADKRKTGETVYQAMLAVFEPLLASSHFALSFEIREIDAGLSWKTNTMHARLRNSR